MIEVRALTKVFGSHRAVDELSFTAPPGMVTGFLGPNGAGKTTTFRCLLGLAEPTSGVGLIDGRRYRDLLAPRRAVGAVLESVGFHPSRTGRNHLRVIARAAGIDQDRVDATLALVDLEGAADRRVGSYSSGMHQRLALAAAMLGDAGVLVLDEPANGLDPEGVLSVRRLLREWAAEGRTVLVSSHLLAEVAQIADRVVVIRGGRLIVETGVAALIDRVIVRVDRVEPMLEALRAQSAKHEVMHDGAIAIAAKETGEVGAIAAGAGVTVLELSRVGRGEMLEAMFFAATCDGGDLG